MNPVKFLVQYFKSPRVIGAVAPSSGYLAEKMVSDIDFDKADCIVEYGPGTGVFTEKLISRKREDTLLIIIECNRAFYEGLMKIYKHKSNVKIIHDGAENIEKYLRQYGVDKVDYIVSGIPFASLPIHVSEKILDSTRKILKDTGEFSTFQYSLIKMKFFKSYFNEIKTRKVTLNIPPAYVLKCKL